MSALRIFHCRYTIFVLCYICEAFVIFYIVGKQLRAQELVVSLCFLP
jgi:hypothetical protein